METVLPLTLLGLMGVVGLYLLLRSRRKARNLRFGGPDG